MTSKYPAFGRGARPLECRECGAKRKEGAQISARGLCLPCGHTRASESAEQLMAREGPYYDEYVRGMVAFARALIRS